MIIRVLLFVIVAATAFAGRLRSRSSAHDEDRRSRNSQSEFFTKEWRKLYNEETLRSQPKWRLVKPATSQSNYQIREYVNIQWAGTTSCFNESKATASRKKMVKILSERMVYSPLITKAFDPMKEGLPDLGLEMEEIEQCRYTFQFYYPLYGAENDFDFSIDYSNSSTFYVLTYSGNFTMAHCNEKAKELGKLLENDGQKYVHSTWKCAQYEPGIGSTEVRYEVWLQKNS